MPKKVENMVDVAVMAALPRPLTYRVPDGLTVRTGQRVFVPLGRRRAQGIVLEPRERFAPGIELRDITAVIDPEPLLSPELLTLGLWVAEYYIAPPGEVFRAMLPLLKETRRAERFELTAAGRARLDGLRAAAKTGDAAPELEWLEALAGRPLSLEAAIRRIGAVGVEQLREQGFAEAHTVEEKQARRAALEVRLTGPLPETMPRLSPAARRILDALAAQPAPESSQWGVSHRALLKASGGSLSHLRKLRDAGLVDLKDHSAYGGTGAVEAEPDPSFQDERLTAPPPELTPAQTKAFDEIAARLDQRKFSTVLLYGVTGSGKTEVYLRLIARALAAGRTALAMVPEIALTPAVKALFESRFGNDVAVLHSGLAAGDRHRAWWRAARGEARVVLGTRSAVFAPLQNLGLVIVDEEHEASYKQDETPRYHGRDVAVVRARLAGAVCVLGSATPSLESYANAGSGKYALVRLPERIAGRPMATVEVIDMRAEFRKTFSKIPISQRLREEIQAQLAAKAQTIILLNRRGYSWFLLCRSCGETPGCVNCSVALTYHRKEHRLVCHYCGYSLPVPTHCPACKSEFIHYVGEGTEKIEDSFRELFPEARVARLDRDVARRAGQYEHVLGAVRRGEIDILIGTQLVSKGHDFPGVTLVGVVSADQGLRLVDFRAAERTFQLLTQVAGRSGRGEQPGRVLVQTFYPEHYAIRLAAEQNYEAFFAKEMRFRRMMRYPPVTTLARVVVQHPELEKAAEIAKTIDRYFKRAIPGSGDSEGSGTRQGANRAPAPSGTVDRNTIDGSTQGSAANRPDSTERIYVSIQGSEASRPDAADPDPRSLEPDTGLAVAASAPRPAALGSFRFKVLGPGPAPLARIEGRHRIQFLIKSASRVELSRLLIGLADFCQAERIAPAHVMIDMDPLNVM